MAKKWTSALESLPWRGPAEERPELPLPPGSMPVRFAGTWRKRWRYVGAFGERVMLCAASVRIGPMGQSFWAILDRESGAVIENTKQLFPAQRGEVWTERAGGHEVWELGAAGDSLRTKIESKEANAKLSFADCGVWAEAICPNGEGGYVWTRKRPSWIDLDLDLGERGRIRERVRGIEDESAGYHPRRTIWNWSAGVGTSADGRQVAWNLVEGVNDPATGSERSIWVDGDEAVREPGPVRFDGLEAVDFGDGSRLAFAADAERRAEENRLVVKYSYRQPFGRFSGSLPGVELAEGIGVMEHQDALW
ncbi:MAG: DUF2804 family protein [Solirubrobacterales bacterium]